MTTQTIDITPDRAADTIATFLPPGVRAAFLKLVGTLEGADVQVDVVLRQILDLGESILAAGLDATVDGLEAVIEQLYELGLMDRLGQLNSFARDGAEIGIHVTVNALKALTPADVAKILGVALILWLAPNVLVLNGAEFLPMAAELASKMWNLG